MRNICPGSTQSDKALKDTVSHQYFDENNNKQTKENLIA